MRPLRAVFISPITPARTGNGLAMRMGMFAEALSRIAQVDVIVVPVAGHAGQPTSFLEGLGIRLHHIDVEGRSDTHFALLSRLPDEQARLEAFQAYGKPSLARALSAPVLADIGRIVEQCRPDLIHIGRSYLSPCIESCRPHIPATLDLDEDDLDSFASQARQARRSGHVSRAAWLEQEGLACDALIGRYGPHFRRIFVANQQDRVRLKSRHAGLASETMPNAVDIPQRALRQDDGQTVLFVGSLQYAPNVDGIIWFARSVLPLLRSRWGDTCRLLIAGARPPSAVASLARHPLIAVTGWVDGVARLYRRSTLAIAPLHAGGGTRIKLLEAAAHRVASVATPAAACGIEWPSTAGGWRAETAHEFAEACRTALLDAPERQRRAGEALQWVKQHHARNRIIMQLAQSLAAAPIGLRPSPQSGFPT